MNQVQFEQRPSTCDSNQVPGGKIVRILRCITNPDFDKRNGQVAIKNSGSFVNGLTFLQDGHYTTLTFRVEVLTGKFTIQTE